MMIAKQLNITKKVVTTLLVLLTTTILAVAQGQLPTSGDGSENNPYLIQTITDWNNLADYVANDHNCAGLFFKMTADIGSAAEPVQKPLGKQIDKNKTRRRFAGNFDGDGHTLYVDINNSTNPYNWFQYNASYCAPFAYAQGVTIQNLHVTGIITTTGQFASGLVGQSGPDNQQDQGTCTITNCHVSVVFYCNTIASSKGNHGIFIAIPEGTATITDCWFDGELRGNNYLDSGGFIGLNKGTGTTLNNCLFNPNVISIVNDNISGSCEFVHENGGSHTLTNCYYTKSFSAPVNAQGTKVVTSIPAGATCQTVTAADGQTYYIITGNAAWQAIQYAFTNNTDYQLSQDVTAGSNDATLVVPAGSNVELDLNGYTLDRALDIVEAQPSGYVIWVNTGATLTITDSGTDGIIRGGNNKNTTTSGGNGGKGGGIYNEGTLIINGGTITGNRARMGGGIYNAWDATLTMTDGVITGNNATESGSGIYCRKANGHTSTFNVNGNVQIYDNIKNNIQNNVYLETGYVITIGGNLGNSSIGLYMQTNGDFTSGLNSYGNISNFTSDKSEYTVVLNGTTNEAQLVPCISINVAGYGSGNDKWMFIASPVTGSVDPYDVQNLIGSATSAPYDYDLFRFNQAIVAGEWENYIQHSSDFELDNGKGYLYANKNNVTLRFTGTFNSDAEKVVDLDYVADKPFSGYNLVGNPFKTKAYIDRAYYKMNAAGTDIVAESSYTTKSIAACTGVIVQATGQNETVTFSTTAPSSKSASDNGSIRMTVSKKGASGDEIHDNAIVSFNKGNNLGKFIFNENHAKLYIQKNSKDYAVVSAERNGEVQVNFKAKDIGTYIIDISGEDTDLNGIYLVDKIEGAVIDLSVNPNYTFIGSAVDRIDRFKLVFNANDFNGDNFAYQSGNDIVVSGEGELQVFDVTGRLVMKNTISGVQTVNVKSQGVYIFRLGEKIQKIVVR